MKSLKIKELKKKTLIQLLYSLPQIIWDGP